MIPMLPHAHTDLGIFAKEVLAEMGLTLGMDLSDLPAPPAE